MKAIQTYTEAAFAVGVTGAAMVWPPLALLVCAAFLLGLAYVTDKRTPEVEL